MKIKQEGNGVYRQPAGAGCQPWRTCDSGRGLLHSTLCPSRLKTQEFAHLSVTLDYPQENLREARFRVPAQPRALGRWTSGGRRGDMQGKEKA